MSNTALGLIIKFKDIEKRTIHSFIVDDDTTKVFKDAVYFFPAVSYFMSFLQENNEILFKQIKDATFIKLLVNPIESKILDL